MWRLVEVTILPLCHDSAICKTTYIKIHPLPQAVVALALKLVDANIRSARASLKKPVHNLQRWHPFN